MTNEPNDKWVKAPYEASGFIQSVGFHIKEFWEPEHKVEMSLLFSPHFSIILIARIHKDGAVTPVIDSLYRKATEIINSKT